MLTYVYPFVPVCNTGEVWPRPYEHDAGCCGYGLAGHVDPALQISTTSVISSEREKSATRISSGSVLCQISPVVEMTAVRVGWRRRFPASYLGEPA